VDKHGRRLDEISLRNAPRAEQYPDKQLIQIQWTLESENKPNTEELAPNILFIKIVYWLIG